MTVNGQSTYSCKESSTLSKRGIGAGNETDVNLNSPPYAIHNGLLIYVSLREQLSSDVFTCVN
jgi:hypothetical protein